VRLTQLRHQFTDEAPDQLEAGILYVSMPYRTTLHLCCCGCDNQVALPLRPTAWKLTYDGDTITMSPSVGNWSFPCRSHYWIRNNQVEWAGSWTDDQIAAGRRRTLQERGAVPTNHAPPIDNRTGERPVWWRRAIRAVTARFQ
jgi:hypothetical protein